MTNAEIRKRARRLYRAHAGKLLLMSFGISFLYFLVQALVGVTGRDEFTLVALLALEVVAAPVVVLGAYAVALAVWRGEAPGAGQLFQFIRTPALIGRSILLLFLIALAFVGVGFLGFIANIIFLYIYPPLVYLVQIALYIACIWVEIRLFLAPWRFALNPEPPVSRHLGQSFRLMKGRVGRYIGFMFGLCWWPLLLIAVATGTCFALIPISATMELQYLRWGGVVLWAGMALFAPYLYLAQAGFASEAIQGGPGSPAPDVEVQ